MESNFFAFTDTIFRRTDWAEDEDEDPLALPPPEIIKNADGTESHITYKYRDDGKKIKTTRIIRRTVVKTKVNPRIAESRQWAKFGASVKDGQGPNSSTTTVGEDIQLHPKQGYKGHDKAEEPGSAQAKLDDQKLKLSGGSVKCRICQGDHFTARCPFKGTMAPEGEPGLADVAADPMAETGFESGGAGGLKSSYIPPALRKGGAALAGEKMSGGKYERDDLATLRVTNVSWTTISRL